MYYMHVFVSLPVLHCSSVILVALFVRYINPPAAHQLRDTGIPGKANDLEAVASTPFSFWSSAPLKKR